MSLITPPLNSYSPNRLRRLCKRLMQGEPRYLLPTERLVIQDMHSNLIPSHRAITEHAHSFYEAHIVFDGEAVVTAGRALPVSTGTALLLAPRTPHAWETRDHSVRSFVVWFAWEGAAPLVPLRWASLPGLLWVIQLMLLEVQAGETGWRDRTSALLSALLSRILAFTADTHEVIPITEDDAQLVTLIDHFLWDNLSRPLSVGEVAAHVGMSERNLYRRFREMTGQTLTQRLLNLRIQRAQTLLEESDATLSAIGQQVGIPDPAYFCRVFKHQTRMTPHQYRVYMRP